VLITILGCAGLSPAQEPRSAPGAVTQTSGPSRALQVVAGFLNLSSDQVRALPLLLHARQLTQGPLLQGIAERERRIQELLESGGDPSEIGRLAVEIHRLRQGVAQAQAEFLARFGELLDEDQRQRWSAVHMAERLQPILPAFQTLRLL
jgi:hypothetical protein